MLVALQLAQQFVEAVVALLPVLAVVHEPAGGVRERLVLEVAEPRGRLTAGREIGTGPAGEGIKRMPPTGDKSGVAPESERFDVNGETDLDVLLRQCELVAACEDLGANATALHELSGELNSVDQLPLLAHATTELLRNQARTHDLWAERVKHEDALLCRELRALAVSLRAAAAHADRAQKSARALVESGDLEDRGADAPEESADGFAAEHLVQRLGAGREAEPASA